jgi:hypothetical protein
MAGRGFARLTTDQVMLQSSQFDGVDFTHLKVIGWGGTGR